MIGSEVYRGSTYGAAHPLAIPRVSTCVDLCRAMGWLPDARYREAPMASVAEVTRFHDPAYVAALREAERAGYATEVDRARFQLGARGNPVFTEVYRRPMTSAGGMLLAARLVAEGGVVHCPGGGTHHGRAGQASGFCYLNDVVLAVLAWLDAGLERIAYVDIDAHHGDGVQDAFGHDPRVLTVSVHEAGRWPHTGAVEDRAGGAARNLPVPAGLNDTEFRFLLEQAVLPLVAAHRPQAILLQCGADALEEDPLARLSLSNNAHFGAVSALMAVPVEGVRRLVVTGGGGYNPWSVGRCWAGVWATLCGLPIPGRTTAEAEAVLRALRFGRAAGRHPPEHWFTTIRDAPREGDVRDAVREVAARVVAP
ncbi:MAG: acetoin utilization protein AcuC [Janthinobacterium lividum]